MGGIVFAIRPCFSVVVALVLMFGAPEARTAEQSPPTLESFPIDCPEWLTLNVISLNPVGTPIADVIYVHGFADRAQNHLPLFEQWRKAGYRVIAFDLPSHGNTTGFGRIDFHSFSKLGRYVRTVADQFLQDPKRPLIVAGWSTGALIAIRSIQLGSFDGAERRPSGLVLFAPGVAVRLLVGTFGIVTTRTLTSNQNPPHVGRITPRSPFLTPLFATRLLFNAWRARNESFPKELPTLVLTGGDEEDRYVQTARVEAWAKGLRDGGAQVWNVSFPNAFHELDNEPGPVGNTVRSTSVEFVKAVLAGTLAEFHP